MVSMEITNWQNGLCSWEKKLREKTTKNKNRPCEKVKTLSFKNHTCVSVITLMGFQKIKSEPIFPPACTWLFLPGRQGWTRGQNLQAKAEGQDFCSQFSLFPSSASCLSFWVLSYSHSGIECSPSPREKLSDYLYLCKSWNVSHPSVKDVRRMPSQRRTLNSWALCFSLATSDSVSELVSRC